VSGYYSGLHFHRVIPGFMNQFGCPKSRNPSARDAGTGGPDGNTTFKNLKTGESIRRDGGGNIPDEFAAKITNAVRERNYIRNSLTDAIFRMYEY
jgi:cyclophilin family peptidyl-prolyl cis-trans isomerase